MAAVRSAELFMLGSARADGLSPFVPFHAILVLVWEPADCRSSRFSLFYSPGQALPLLANFPLAPAPPKWSSNPVWISPQNGMISRSA